MPWFLIVLVIVTTAVAVAASTMMERLAALGGAEAVIVAYLCIAIRRSGRHRGSAAAGFNSPDDEASAGAPR